MRLNQGLVNLQDKLEVVVLRRDLLLLQSWRWAIQATEDRLKLINGIHKLLIAAILICLQASLRFLKKRFGLSDLPLFCFRS